MTSAKAEYTHVGPGLPPLHGAKAAVLILGSFPSPKAGSRDFSTVIPRTGSGR